MKREKRNAKRQVDARDRQCWQGTKSKHLIQVHEDERRVFEYDEYAEVQRHGEDDQPLAAFPLSFTDQFAEVNVILASIFPG